MSRSVADEREHRRGLVLGLTMAEVLLLLLFLLLLALGARLTDLEGQVHAQEQKVLAAEQVLNAQGADDAAAIDLASIAGLNEELTALRAENEWLGVQIAELHEASPAAEQLALKEEELRQLAATVEKARTIDPEGPIEHLQRAVDIAALVGPDRTLQELKSILSEADAAAAASAEPQPGGHRWPPIITLSEADGYYFATGSAALRDDFRAALTSGVVDRILEIVAEYDVDIIEVIGHTDERPLRGRSNLDDRLLPVLSGAASVTSLRPGDNAGLGLARAASVVAVLRSDERLAGQTILALSAGQLIDLGDRPSTGAAVGDMPERRRIEIRARRSDTSPE